MTVLTISKQIQHSYRLSRSTIRRLQCMHRRRIGEYFDETKSKSTNCLLSEEAKNLTREFIQPPCRPMTIWAIMKQIELKLGEIYSNYKIKQFVAKDMRYSYKKGSSRPPKYATNTVQLVKVLYCTELLKLLIDGKVVVNVDESSFDRSIKNQYSWLPKGKSEAILNDNIKGKATLILATWSTGDWFAVVTVGTVDSKKFWAFLKLLEFVLKENSDEFENLPTVVLDNARTHSSNLTKKVIKHLAYEVRFSAPYCPEVAPVEQAFGKIKLKLRSLGGTTIINFLNEKGIMKIFRLLESIEESSWIKDWVKMIREARNTILKFVGQRNLTERCESKHRMSKSGKD